MAVDLDRRIGRLGFSGGTGGIGWLGGRDRRHQRVKVIISLYGHLARTDVW